MVTLGSAGAGARFRLVEQVADVPGSALWRATDALLGRTVAIRMLVPGRGQERAAMVAACAASRLNDPRFAAIYDADVSGTPRQIIAEWPTGESLDTLLRRGPLDPADALRLVGQAAGALAEAHAHGLAHQRLTPRSLVVTPAGSIKILGLEVDAALRGFRAEDPALADAQGLARLLYAAVTGCWPEDGAVSLLPRWARWGPAPHAMPRPIEAVIRRTLAPGSRRRRRRIDSPAEFAKAIAQHRDRARRPFTASNARLRAAASASRSSGRGLGPSAIFGGSARGWRTPVAGGVFTGCLIVSGAVVMLGASSDASSSPGRAIPGVASSGIAGRAFSSTRAPADVRLRPVAAWSLDSSGRADGAVTLSGAGGRPAWRSQWYATAHFGNLKKGTGLVVDLGKAVSVTRVRATIGGGEGGDLQLRIADRTAGRNDEPVAAWARGASGPTEVRFRHPARGRYVLFWFTRLPRDGDVSGTFRASVRAITVHGHA